MSTRIDVVHRFDFEPASLRNLLQGIATIDDSWDVHVHSLLPNLPFDNVVSSAAGHAGMTVSTLSTALKLKLRADSDLLIIHKPLHGEPVEFFLGVNVAERAFLNADNVVYSTYDADYVHFPEKATLLFQNADLVLATSRAIEREAQKYTTDDRIAYVPPSVDVEFFNPDYTVPTKWSSEKLVLGWVGDLDSHRDNLQHLSDRLSDLEVQDVILRLLLGGNSLPADLRTSFEASGVELDVVEYVPWEEVPIVINSLDIGLVPIVDTQYNRGRSSEKAREYMSCGVPVIASDVGENKHLVADGTGILVDSPEDWAEAIEVMSSPETRQEMGKQAREHMEMTYAIDVLGDQLEVVLGDLIN